MRKLGFEGRLGKDGQGIAQPIATKVGTPCKSINGRNDQKVWVWVQMVSRRQPVCVQTGRSLRSIAKYSFGAKDQTQKLNANQEEKEEKEKKDWWKSSSDEEGSQSSDSEDNEDEEGVFSASDSDEDDRQYARKKKTHRV